MTPPLAVLDTNTIISALYGPGCQREVLNAVTRGEVAMVISPFILFEVRNTLVVKMRWAEERAERAIETIANLSIIVDPLETIFAIPDNNPDNRILECAHEGRAAFIVTGDHAFLRLRKYKSIAIVSARQFLDILGGL